MDTIILLEVAGVIAAWAVVAFTIWRWGPGLRRRTVSCPNLKVHAQVVANQREAEFGCLRVHDIQSCSLIPDVLLDCKKECLARL